MALSARVTSGPFPDKTYHVHMTMTHCHGYSNFTVQCTCGYICNIASVSDLCAAEVAYQHVLGSQPATPEGGE